MKKEIKEKPYSVEQEEDVDDETEIQDKRVSLYHHGEFLYKDLLSAEQDEHAVRLNLDDKDQKENGLFSNGFAACFAIIMISHDKRRFSLAHVSSPPKKDYVILEAEFVSCNFEKEYSIQLAICRTGYDEVRDPKDQDSKEFFSEAIPAYTKLLQESLRKKPTQIHELSESSMLLLDRSGALITFPEYKDQDIEVQYAEATPVVENPAPIVISGASFFTPRSKRKREDMPAVIKTETLSM